MIPATPRPEGIALPTSRPTVLQVGTSQPPETSAGNLYSRIIKEAMAKLNHDRIKEGETSSIKGLSEAVTSSDTQPICPTSFSSLRFSTDNEGKAEENQGKKGTGRTFEEVVSEVIREMHEIERKGNGKSKETLELGEPLQAPTRVVSREPQEDPIREIYDLTETDDEKAAAPDDWRNQMEETVNRLVAANAEQNALLKSQGEQMTRVVGLVDRVISWMERESQSFNQPSRAVSASGQNEPQQNVPDTN